MKNSSNGRWACFVFTVLLLGLPSVASAQLTFSSIVVFGTSLSDPGNAFALITNPAEGLDYTSNVTQSIPPYNTLDESLVPDAPYARGGHHFSNGATWIEQFAQLRGFAADVGPAFASNGSKARNYAVGGARATAFPGRVNLPQQVQAFLTAVNQTPDPDALYVVEIGNNDVRDAVVAYFTAYAASGGDQAQAEAAAGAVITGALNGIADNIQTLYQLGARKFLVWNAARIDLVPAVTALGAGPVAVASNLTSAFNLGLANSVLSSSALGGLPGIQIAQLDIASRMATIIGDPINFGLTDVTDPCVTPNTPPFTCKQPDDFFFWDGIHPTKAVHANISQLAADVLANYPSP